MSVFRMNLWNLWVSSKGKANRLLKGNSGQRGMGVQSPSTPLFPLSALERRALVFHIIEYLCMEVKLGKQGRNMGWCKVCFLKKVIHLLKCHVIIRHEDNV